MIEKRQHPRLLVEQLHAEITVVSQQTRAISVYKGDVVDMSFSGIKIKLLSAMQDNQDYGKITITLSHPQLSIPISIKGMIRHKSITNECGIAFSNLESQDTVDSLLFECKRVSRQAASQ